MGFFSEIAGLEAKWAKQAEERMENNLEGLAQRCERKLAPKGYSLDSFSYSSMYKEKTILCNEVELAITDADQRKYEITIKQPNIRNDNFSGFGYQHPDVNYYEEIKIFVALICAFAKADKFNLKDSLIQEIKFFYPSWGKKNLKRTSSSLLEGFITDRSSGLDYLIEFPIKHDESLYLEETRRKKEKAEEEARAQRERYSKRSAFIKEHIEDYFDEMRQKGFGGISLEIASDLMSLKVSATDPYGRRVGFSGGPTPWRYPKSDLPPDIKELAFRGHHQGDKPKIDVSNKKFLSAVKWFSRAFTQVDWLCPSTLESKVWLQSPHGELTGMDCVEGEPVSTLICFTKDHEDRLEFDYWIDAAELKKMKDDMFEPHRLALFHAGSEGISIERDEAKKRSVSVTGVYRMAAGFTLQCSSIGDHKSKYNTPLFRSFLLKYLEAFTEVEWSDPEQDLQNRLNQRGFCVLEFEKIGLCKFEITFAELLRTEKDEYYAGEPRFFSRIVFDKESFLAREERMRRELCVKTMEQSENPDFDSMDGHEFESFCANLLRNNGFSDVEITRGSGDQGIDVLATKDFVKYGIQCKCYSSDIGNKAVQEAFAGKTYYGCHVAVVLTNRYFTAAAKDLAAQAGVVLWDRDKLLSMMD